MRLWEDALSLSGSLDRTVLALSFLAQRHLTAGIQ